MCVASDFCEAVRVRLGMIMTTSPACVPSVGPPPTLIYYAAMPYGRLTDETRIITVVSRSGCRLLRWLNCHSERLRQRI